MKNKIKKEVVIEIEDFGNKFYDLFEELYEMWAGLDVVGRYIDMGFWKEQIQDYVDWEDMDEDWEKGDLLIELLSEVKKYDDDVLLKF